MNNVRKLWENSNITSLYPALAASARYDEPMSAHTTFRVGGPADLFVEPSTAEELRELIGFFTSNGIPVSILGGGSNLLIADRGIRGAVVSLASFNKIGRIPVPNASVPSGRVLVRAGAGCTMKALTEWCAADGIGGMERFAGLPGSVGGAVFMNARCYEQSVSDVFFAAEVLYFRNGRCILEERTFNPAEWDYKKSPFQERTGKDPLLLNENTRIILSAVFSLSSGSRETITKEMEKYVQDRETKGHFRYPSAGSMFKNNHSFGKPSGRIIDEAGLRGFRIGDAQVAPWHGNFVINTGNALARDIRTLVEEVERQVYAKTGFSLEPEVIIAGDW